MNTPREYFIDWLRVFVILMLIPLHTAMIFSFKYLDGTFINNPQIDSTFLRILCDFILQWNIALLFFLAGASTWFALKFKSLSQYGFERIKKLFIPFLFGVFTILPILSYIRAISRFDFKGNFFQFFPQFFNGIYPNGNFVLAHLWFIFYLFLFSIIALPFFIKWSNISFKDRMSPFFIIPFLFIFLVVFNFFISILLNNVGTIGKAIYPFSLFPFFVYGYFLFSKESYLEFIEKLWKIFLVLATILSIVLISTQIENIIFNLLYAVCSFSWILFFIGFGKKIINFNNSLLKYLGELSYPFYIIHMLIITLVGFYVVKSNMYAYSQFFIICFLSLIGTFLFCELVKKFEILRFLFGMKKLEIKR